MRGFWRSKAAPIGLTDEEFVQRIRQLVAVYDRWRLWTRAFYAGSAVASIGLLVAIVLSLERLKRIALMQQGLAPGFLVGMLLGGMAGVLAFKTVHFLGAALTSLRMERLLLKYHDALTELAQESEAACENEESRV